MDKKDLNRLQLTFSEFTPTMERANVKAINKTTKTIQTQSVARIANDINLTSARIKKDFFIGKAKYSFPMGFIRCSSRPVTLARYKGTRQTKKGVKVKMIRRGGKAGLIPHAFIGGSNKKGQDGINFVIRREYWKYRRGPGRPKNPKIRYASIPYIYRYKIEILSGPRVSDYFADDRIMVPIMQQASHIHPLNVDYFLKEELRRMAN